MTPVLLPALLALCAAVSWGSGDFTNGLAARKSTAFHTILIAYSIGLLVLLTAAIFNLEKLPPASDLAWGALAGISGMIGLAFLLRGFQVGRMGIVAPVSAVLAAIVPVIASTLREGLPDPLKLIGFSLALAAIWLLSRPEPLQGRPAGISMALLAGLFFGGFFTMLDFIRGDTIFWPLISGRAASLVVMILFALMVRRQLVPKGLPWGLLALAGVLDVGGNLFFLKAVQTGRLDAAAVLGSLYPAVTALLAWLIAHERMARVQVLGAAAAILAIVLITI
jgi:drug/metabolite transporter (DMT)-like permease